MLRSYLLAVLGFSIVASAQSGPTAPSISRPPVTVGFFALDRDKHPYVDLKQEDLTILDNKQPARSVISLKKGSDLPLRVGLLIDASNSQRRSALYKPAVLAGWDSLNQILKGVDDEVFVEKVTMEHEASDFMSAAQFKSYGLHAAPEGGTALYDGVGFACDSRMKTDEPRASRRVLVVLSDGDDDGSQISREAAIAKALEAGVVIFSVSTADDSSAPYVHGPKGDSTLEHFAEETGGEAFPHLNRKKVEQTFSSISEAVNNMYFVTFEPPDGSEKGLHRIELKTSGKNKVRFRAPKGYYHQ